MSPPCPLHETAQLTASPLPAPSQVAWGRTRVGVGGGLRGGASTDSTTPRGSEATTGVDKSRARACALAAPATTATAQHGLTPARRARCRGECRDEQLAASSSTTRRVPLGFCKRVSPPTLFASTEAATHAVYKGSPAASTSPGGGSSFLSSLAKAAWRRGATHLRGGGSRSPSALAEAPWHGRRRQCGPVGSVAQQTRSPEVNPPDMSSGHAQPRVPRAHVRPADTAAWVEGAQQIPSPEVNPPNAGSRHARPCVPRANMGPADTAAESRSSNRCEHPRSTRPMRARGTRNHTCLWPA
jgi:hypothetical protein